MPILTMYESLVLCLHEVQSCVAEHTAAPVEGNLLTAVSKKNHVWRHQDWQNSFQKLLTIPCHGVDRMTIYRHDTCTTGHASLRRRSAHEDSLYEQCAAASAVATSQDARTDNPG